MQFDKLTFDKNILLNQNFNNVSCVATVQESLFGVQTDASTLYVYPICAYSMNSGT